jgi:murein DD-endopeptidase MepM/ murein hydrolase activator NlpD
MSRSVQASFLAFTSILLVTLSPAVIWAQTLHVLSGDFTQAATLLVRTQPGNQVTVQNQPVLVQPDGRFIFGLDRDAPEKVEIVITPPSGQPETLVYPVAKRSYRIQRLNFPLTNAQGDPEIDARLAAEREANLQARLRFTDLPYAFQSFIWPAKGRVTSNFGNQRMINGELRQPHYGIDIAGPVGAPVFAPADGVVSLTANMLLSGGTLYVDHGQGLSSSFLHLHKILVQEGETVRQGQKIAEIGRTGRVTGSHLHWQVSWLHQRVDASHLIGQKNAAGASDRALGSR